MRMMNRHKCHHKFTNDAHESSNEPHCFKNFPSKK